MAVRLIPLRTMRISVEEESTEGTPVAETANGAMKVASGGATFNLERDWLMSNMMSGSFSKDSGEPGMYSKDMGATLPTLLRGIGTLGANGPDWQMPMKSAFGSELRATSGTIDTGATAYTFAIKTGGANVAPGMLLYFPTQSEVRRVLTYSSPNVTLDVPLSAIPAEDNAFICGVNWMLTSAPDHPIYTLYGYFGDAQDMRVRLTSCKTSKMVLKATVGGHCELEFTAVALSPTLDNTAQGVTPSYDNTTKELTCLGVEGWGRIAGTVKGTPTTEETVLSAPNFDVRVGDYLQADVGTNEWETVLISDVSGDAGGDLTLTHAALGAAATATETAYVLRNGCADSGSEVTITLDCPVEVDECIYDDYGRAGIASVDRNITIESNPKFKSWEQFLMRDNAVGMGMMMIFGDIAGDDQNNIVAVYISNKVVTGVSINNETFMSQSVTAQAAIDTTLGNEYEMVIAAF